MVNEHSDRKEQFWMDSRTKEFQEYWCAAAAAAAAAAVTQVVSTISSCSVVSMSTSSNMSSRCSMIVRFLHQVTGLHARHMTAAIAA
jgi:hypothetical protein